MNAKTKDVEGSGVLLNGARAVGAVAVAGVVSGAWLLGLDRLSALMSGSPALGGVGTRAVWAGLTSTGTALALAALLLMAARRGLKGRAPPWVVPLLGALLFAGAMGWPMHRVARALARGDWVARQSWAGTFRYGLLSAGILGAAVLGGLHGWTGQRAHRRGWIWATTLLGTSALLLAADARIFPGLYPIAHAFLVTLACVLAYLGWLRWVGARLWRRPKLGAALGGVALLGLVAAPLGWRTWGPKARAAMLVGSPLAQNVLPLLGGGDASALLRHVLVQLDLSEPDAPEDRRPSAAPVVRPDWNIIVVVVDTLRADAFPPGRNATTRHSKPGDIPRIEAWLKTAQVFGHAYSQASRTQFSMPPLMRSSQPFENAKALGAPVAEEMAARGRIPVAVVPQYFIMPMDKRVEHLLEGYADVALYETDDQKAWFPLFQGVLDRLNGRTFFAWVHFYAMHQPGYDGRLLKNSDGPWETRYGRSLRWMDVQLGLLFDELERRGLKENTVVVLTSDHGENLGEGGKTGHGGSVIERQVRVPLAIYVPGRAGAMVETVVGNIDIMPTTLDLVGAEPVPTHRGRSLRTLMDDPKAAWGEAYSLTNGNGAIHALVDGTDKLVFYPKAGVTFRYDLAKDPTEQRNLFDPGGAIDQRLALRLLMRNGEQARRLMRADKEGLSRQMVSRHLKSVTAAQANAAGRKLSFLLSLASERPSASELAQVERLFTEGDDATRLRIMDTMFKAHGRTLGELLKARLVAVAGTDAELTLLAGLADQGQGQFERPFTSGQTLAAAQAGELLRLDAWLRLTRPWTKQDRFFGAAFNAALLLASQPEASPRFAMRVLSNITTTKTGRRSRTAARRASLLLPYLQHADPLVAAEAGRALGATGQSSSAAGLRAMLVPEVDVRVRKAAMMALAQIVGAAAVDDVVAQGADPLLVVDAVQVLGKLGPKAKRGLPFLRKTARKHYIGFARREAKKALEQVQGKSRKGKNKKKRGKRGKKRKRGKGAQKKAHAH